MGLDTIIIGGGVMGCAIAWRAAQSGRDVLVLERAIPGAEASSAAAGILAAQEESRGPGPLTELALRSRARFRDWAAELRDLTGIDIGYRTAGVLAVAFSAEEEAALDARYAWQRAAGHRLSWLRGAELAACEPALAQTVRAGLHFPDDAQLEPRAYLRALALAAAQAGAQFRTGAYVRRVVSESGRVLGVELEGELLRARHVVVAAGSWSALVEGAELPPRALQPVRGQIAELETRPPAVQGTIVAAGGYVVGRRDGRVLAGSTMERVGFDRRVTVAGLHHVLAVAQRLVPSLAEAPISDSWANFRPATSDELPVIGPGPREGLIIATGHFRNGILLSAATAELVCDLLSGTASQTDLEPFRLARLA